METIRAYTTIEQSRKLAEILPLDSADHHYVRKVTDFMGNPVDGEWSHPKYGNPNSKYADYIVQNFTSYEKLPCWSLASLLEVLPNKIISHETAFEDEDAEDINYTYYKHLEVTEDDRYMCYYKEIDIKYDCYADNPIDACYELILKLHEHNLL